ncbi:CDC9 ATP-dependent DNA ligase [uncultured Caudovirales phage]|uniref:DNA ligase n=1 Tax=uncultured Caudovirales phage TaxID=2100421 RepID=A0A6J5T149_9CAUD|nr:CDC9 ATP-dependent DNA ligase [uncultured Caudovirales phage]
MDKPWHVINDLEVHASRINKEQIIQAQAEWGNTEFFQGCRLALDPMITFGLKQIPEKTNEDGPGLDWDNFSLIITGFVNRSFTGNLARDTVLRMMASATKAQWNNWYRRILIKDMRAGFGENTVNKVVGKKFPQYAIPVFSCQLAHDSANHEGKVCGKKLVEVKLDGVRVLTIVYPDGRVDQFSRNGKELVNFPHIREQFERTVTGVTEPVVFDGEIMSSSFQDLMKQVHRKSNVQANDAVLHLFDFLTLAAFEQGSWDRKQTDRSEKLKDWKNLWAEETPNIEIVGQELVDLDTDAGQARYLEINKQAIAGGYEGIMLKDPTAAYECKRSVAWLKLKPFIEVSLEITNVEEGTGKNVGRLGALVCSGNDEGRDVRVNVGSGFSDDLRTQLWDVRDSVCGQIVEVRADAITQNQDGTYSLRFPRFLRFRGFAPGEKI